MIKIKQLFVLLFFLALSESLFADTFEARVVGVSDGDTLTLLMANKKQVKVMLIEIDAPEKKQAFGQESKNPCPIYVLGKPSKRW